MQKAQNKTTYILNEKRKQKKNFQSAIGVSWLAMRIILILNFNSILVHYNNILVCIKKDNNDINIISDVNESENESKNKTKIE